MIAIYSKLNRESRSDPIRIARQALDVLNTTIERIEVRGESAATERASLEALRAALANAQNGYVPGLH
jgi:hypothetical protein